MFGCFLFEGLFVMFVSGYVEGLGERGDGRDIGFVFLILFMGVWSKGFDVWGDFLIWEVFWIVVLL